MKIYIIYECNAHRSDNSVVIKWMTSAFQKAENYYENNKKDYVGDREWFYNLGIYDLDAENTSNDSNMITDIELYLTTEKY